MPNNSRKVGRRSPFVVFRSAKDIFSRSEKRLSGRRGVVLLIVLLVVAMLALGAYTFSDLMLTEQDAVDLHGDHLQARASTESGIDAARIFLMESVDVQYERGGVYDNPAYFRGRLVIDSEDERQRGRFALLAPLVDEGELGGIRYGLENESTRLNINALLLAEVQQENGGRQLLLGLPGMTEETADAILDWLDDDDEVREFGAELDYYSGVDPPYAPRNGPPETVEELLLVRGVTPDLLFGRDINRNGMIDSHEQSAPVVVKTDVPGAMDRGWSAYLTLHSQERNASPSGQPRIYLNQDDMGQLHAELSSVFPREWANYIVAYRQNGPYSGNTTETAKADSGDIDFSDEGRFTLTQVLDLVGSRTRVRFQGDQQATVLECPFPEELIAMGFYMPMLMDNATVNSSPTIPGRININQAPRVVLQGIPGLDEEMINQIISLRTPEVELERPNRRHETWLLIEAVVTLDEMRGLMPFITGGGDVYRTQTVGYFDGGGASARAEVIIDATSPLPAVVSWRDISHLGRGYALETLGVELIEEQEEQ